MPERILRPLARLLGPASGLMLVVVLFALLEPTTFLTAYNLQTIAAQTVIVGLCAIGMTFVIVSGGIDLSVGATIALASVVTALMLRSGASPGLAAWAGVATGALVGMLNGLMITTLRVVPFIATLGTMGMARGLAKYLAEEQKIDAPAAWLSAIMQKAPSPSFLLVAPGTWLLLGLGLLMSVLLRRSVLGVHVYAVGSNEATARLCGVSVGRVKLWVYTICGLFAGLGGVMQFARLTVGDPTTAFGKELDVIAATVIGGSSLSGGSGGIAGSILGAFMMGVLSNGCTLTGVPNYVQEIVIGAIIVAAVALDHVRKGKSLS
jgi:ribose transport system permease protein